MAKTSEIIKARLEEAGVRYWAGDNIASVLEENDKSGNLLKDRIENFGHKVVKKIIIPPGFFFGIKNLSRSKSLILNMASIKHSKKEFIKIPLNKIKYSW